MRDKPKQNQLAVGVLTGVTAFVGALAAALLATPAMAAQLFATSYDTPNGDGVAHSGSFNYWDVAYTGAGLRMVDDAPLSGGLGDLTDGVVANDFWFNVENAAGTGPYVGWRGDFGVLNPLVTFHFAGLPTISSISIHLDNSLTGGVGTPDQILLDGVSYAFVGPAVGTIGTVTFDGLNLTGATHTIQFVQDPTFVWTFVSEISFFGDSDGRVPEPATLALLGIGLAGLGFSRRKH
jgi:PEP-CTERM motif